MPLPCYRHCTRGYFKRVVAIIQVAFLNNPLPTNDVWRFMLNAESKPDQSKAKYGLGVTMIVFELSKFQFHGSCTRRR